MKTKKRISPMKGRKISEEDRGPNAPKLGRHFKFLESERIVVTLTLPKHLLDDVQKMLGAKSRSDAIARALMLISKQKQ